MNHTQPSCHVLIPLKPSNTKTMRQTPRYFLLLLCAATLTLSLACKEPLITAEQASPYVDQWAQSVGPTLKSKTSEAATEASVKALFAAHMDSNSNGLLRNHPPYDKLAESVYRERKYKPAFITDGELNPQGKAILAQLERVDQDGFNPKYYRVAKIQKDLSTLKTLKKQYASLGNFEPGPKEKALVKNFLLAKEAKSFNLSKDNYKQLTDHLLNHPDGSDIKTQIEQYGKLSKQMAEVEARVERNLSTGLMRYAYKMRYFRTPDIFVHPRQDDRFNDPETRRRRKADEKAVYTGQLLWRQATFVAQRMNKKRGGDFLRAKIQQVLRDAMDTKTNKDALARLVPSPQYAKLRKEYVRYRGLVDAGGWKKIQPKKIRSGQSNDTVYELKLRLQKEGYLPANQSLTKKYDSVLKDAIMSYQASHQMSRDGKVGRSFWRSVNVSAKKRRDQILLNMQRWRKSNIQHHDHDVYVFVNIPDFHTEIWKDQQREMRMRIVVGNNDREEDEETKKKIHPNRTPVLSAFIDRVIYNPFWNVTSRIRETEILVDVRKDLEKRYVAKLDKLMGAAKPAATGPATGLLGTTTTPVSYTKRSKEGLIFNIDRIKYDYQQKHGSEPDIKALFPYLSQETGIIDVSKTDPKNVPPWYAANGYEVMHAGKSWEFVRQLNGKKNALGLVKVIFPNLHDVYLHDTNAKAFFKKDIRAYSHGCMRMHRPLKFAEWILRNDGNYNGKRIKKLIAKTQYEPIFLKTKIPVHIDYFTVRADDQGRANFLIDVYDYDRAPKNER